MPTASIVQLYYRVTQLGKTGTSGYINQDEFNNIITSRQLTLAQLLMEVEQENKKAADMISWLKISTSLTADDNGKITMPTGYLHLDTISLIASAKSYPVSELQSTEVDMVRTSPVRAPSLALNDVNFYFEAGQVVMLPEQAMTIKMRYFKVPPIAALTLTPSGDDDNDYLTPTVGTELGWPASAFNLLAYLVLMDFGVEMKEQAILEFAQFGITMEMIKNAPQ